MRNHRSDFTRGDQPALDEVAQTDLLLDALAARTETRLGAAEGLPAFEDQALAELLGDWRDDLRWPPASALVSQDEAEDALRHGMAHRPRGGRGLAAVGSVAATLLALSGFGAVVADAKPGDLLYGLHAMMFNEPRVNDDQIMLSAKADLAKVEQMIAQGQWDQAQNRLAEVSTTLQGVNDRGRKQGLLAEVNQLNTKLEKRDANATAPANSWTPPLDPGTTASSPPATTTHSPAPTTTTTKPKPTTTTPASPPPTSSKGKPKPSPSATPNTPAAGPSAPASSTPPGALWDRTTGPVAPRTPFPNRP